MKINSKKAGEYFIFLGYLMIGLCFIGISLMFDIRSVSFWGLLIVGLLFVLFSLLINQFMQIKARLDNIPKFENE